ncbi:MAG: ABC transporter permease subunit [Candidatus Heimdallarchaeaceae archaeon]
MNVLFLTFRKNRAFTFWMSLSLVAYILLFVLIYPGKEGVASFLGIIENMETFEFILMNVKGENPSFIIWQAFVLYSLIAYITTIALGIHGSKILVQEIEEGNQDLLYKLSIPRWRIFLEKYSSGMLSLIIIHFSGWAITVLTGLKYKVPFLTTSYIWLSLGIISLLYYSFGCLVTSISLKSSMGNLASTSVSVITLLLFILSGDREELKNILKYTPIYYFKGSEIIVKDIRNWDEIGVILAVALLFSFFSILLMTKKDLIPKVKPARSFIQRVYDFYITAVKKISSIKIIRTTEKKQRSKAVRKKESRFAKKIFGTKTIRTKEKKQRPKAVRKKESRFAILMDKLKADLGLISIFSFYSVLWALSISLVYLGDEEMSKMSDFLDMPIIRAVLFGQSMQPTFVGFLSYKFIGYLWILFLPFIVMQSSRIMNADLEKGTADILYSLPIPRKKVITQRWFTVILEIFLLCALMLVSLIIGQSVKGYTDTIGLEVFVFFEAFIFYSALFSFALFMSVVTKSTKTGGLNTGIISTFIFLFLFAGINPDYKWVSYISPFYYFNYVRVLFDKQIMAIDIISTITFALAAVLLLFFTLHRLNKKDLIKH